MSGFIATLLAHYWQPIAGLLAVVVSFLTVKRMGRNEAKLQDLKDTIDDVKKANDAANDSDVVKRVREQSFRD